MDLATELVKLSEPIAADNACGRSLDETQTLAALEAYRVFGRLQAAADEPEWRTIRAACLEALRDSKDLRVLALLIAATLRVDPLPDVLRVLPLTGAWLNQYWVEVYPRIDDDAIARRNALMFFADRVAIVDALRRAPLVRDARLGSCSVRDFEIANGMLVLTTPDAKPTSNEQIQSVLASADRGPLTQIARLALVAADSLQSVEAVMLARGGGSDAVPRLDDLTLVLGRMHQILAPYVERPVESEVASVPGHAASAVAGTVPKAAQVGAIESREDVLRALDAVLGYYRSHEPGSLVPIVADRAKRLVSMNFLEALAEVAPDAVEPVKKAMGVRVQTS
jgi:type VI secretion system protein ImpA